MFQWLTFSRKVPMFLFPTPPPTLGLWASVHVGVRGTLTPSQPACGLLLPSPQGHPTRNVLPQPPGSALLPQAQAMDAGGRSCTRLPSRPCMSCPCAGLPAHAPPLSQAPEMGRRLEDPFRRGTGENVAAACQRNESWQQAPHYWLYQKAS